jgi:hypothetical protein
MQGPGQFLYQNIVDRCFSPINRARFMSLSASNLKPVLKNVHRSINIVASNAIGIRLDIPQLRPMLLPDPDSNNEETQLRYRRFPLFNRASLLITHDFSAAFSIPSLVSITLAVVIAAGYLIRECLPSFSLDPGPSIPSLLT